MTPVVGGKNVTVTDYKRALTTELTYGLNEFLNDNLTVQWNFLKRIYQDQLEKLGLIGADNNEKTLNYKLAQAIKERDAAYIVQRNLGAFKVHLEKEYGMKCPEPVDIPALELKIKENNSKIQSLIEKISNLNIVAQQEYTTELTKWTEDKNKKQAEITKQINDIANNIALHNHNAQEKYDKSVKDISREIKEQNRLAENIAISKDELVKALREYSAFLVLPSKRKDQIEDAINVINGLPIHGLKYEQTVEDAIVQIPEPILIQDKEIYSPEDIVAYDKILDGKFSKLMKLYDAQEHLESAIFQLPPPKPLSINLYDIVNIPPETRIPLHTEITNLLTANTNLTMKIAEGKESNEIIAKFDAYNEYTKKDEAVQEIRNEIKKAYLKVKTGVEGMTLEYDPDSSNIIVMYDGRLFEHQLGKQPLTSYSHTEKRFIALQLQLYLLSKKERPLNVIYLDELGLDNRTCEKIANFAKEHGLLIITASSGDYKEDDLKENEVLIENGHLIFGDNVKDFTSDELAKLNKEKDEVKAEKPVNTGKIKGKLHQRTIQEEIAERETHQNTEPEKQENKSEEQPKTP
jgi:hypothetical protein